MMGQWSEDKRKEGMLFHGEQGWGGRNGDESVVPMSQRMSDLERSPTTSISRETEAGEGNHQSIDAGSNHL